MIYFRKLFSTYFCKASIPAMFVKAHGHGTNGVNMNIIIFYSTTKK
jgi:hypothetical protein